MAKNFASTYARTGDSIALNQKFFAVEETAKGTLKGPADSDFFFTQAGGSITHTQPKTSSPHRSGRHNNDFFLEKKVTEWSIPTYVNIDVSNPADGTQIEDGIQVLWKSMLGKEDLSGAGPVYNSSEDPDITFSLFENGDKAAQQCPAAFVEAVTISVAGDGQPNLEWSGRAANRLRVGIGKSTTANDGGNTITLLSGAEAKRFPVGALVMIIESDGTTRSADTPNGSYRKVTARNTTTGVVTVDGAVLADADGSINPIYLAYAEPEAPGTGISTTIQDGLKGSFSVDGLGGTIDCVRSVTVTLTNNHEVVDYCYGTDSLATPYFIPGGRLNVEVEMEMNLNDDLIEFLDDLDQFTAQDLQLIIGDATTRHMVVDLPRVVFDVPSTTLPEEGSIPVTVAGMGFQSALDAADEVSVSYL